MRRAMMMTAALLAAAGLAGCVGLSRSSPTAPLATGTANQYRIGEIVLTRGEITPSAEFDGIFQLRVRAKLDACATGDRPLRLEARVDRLDRANPLQTAVIGGANVLRGSARLVDAETGALVGEYQIGRTIVGGRLAVVRMAEAEEQLSDAFGEELCAQAFANLRGAQR